jgi:hypothetical protein
MFVSATVLFPEPDESSSQPHTLFFKIHFNMLPSMLRSSKWNLSLRFFDTLMGTGVIYSGVERPGREANHSSTSRAKVKNAYICMAWCENSVHDVHAADINQHWPGSDIILASY